MVNLGLGPVCFPPYAASAGWYAVWLDAFLRDRHHPVGQTNFSLCLKGKDFARTKIRRSGGSGILSVPIAGGAHSLGRAAAILNARLSDHGDWRRIHLGALDATYGRTPFYPHLGPELRDAIASGSSSLADFNWKVHRVLASFILSGLQRSEDGREYPPVLLTGNAEERATEIALMMDPELSVIDALMRFGPETFLGLLKL